MRDESDTTKQGLVFMLDGSSHFRVWAPNAASAALEVALQMPEPAATAPPASAGAMDDEPDVGTVFVISLRRDGEDFVASIPAPALRPGAGYRVALRSGAGDTLHRRDPYALRADYHSAWCVATDPENWPAQPPKSPRVEAHLIYELHVGSFTAEGTFVAARRRLRHIADLGFTALQLLPVAEHGDAWGLAPRQLLAMHGPYGTPEDFQEFVEAAHGLDLAVLADVPLRCAAAPGSALWAFDGAPPQRPGGGYYEPARSTADVAKGPHRMAYGAPQVQVMLRAACAMMLHTYGCDGVRLRGANDVPREAVQALTYYLHERFPGRLLLAHLDPEDPGRMLDLGLDALHVASARLAVVHQHRQDGPRGGQSSNGAGGDAWELEGVREAVRLHDGFTGPAQCVKAMLGSHGDLGRTPNLGLGKVAKTSAAPSGVGLLGGARNNADTLASQRAWYTAGVAAAGMHMAWMGQEWAQDEWHHAAMQRAAQWQLAHDDTGRRRMEFMRDANNLRRRFPVLHYGACNVIHEDATNGVIAWERVHEGLARMVTVVNMGPGSWQQQQTDSYSYGVWVEHGCFREVFNTQDAKYCGPGQSWVANGALVQSVEGRVELNLPSRCTLVLLQVSSA